MLPSELNKGLTAVTQLARASKVHRLLAHPFRYTYAILFKELVYPRTKKGVLKEADTFFGNTMQVTLPAGTDIFLTGGKSHDSEIRLAQFLIQQLKDGDVFIDIGAHFGYFTLLAANLVAERGKVCSFEASQTTFEVLKENTNSSKNVSIYNQAISNKTEVLSFFEFPVLYSEYNSMDVDQFKNESWYRKYPPKEIQINATTIDQFLSKNKMEPTLIKIDVEGAEYKAIQGLTKTLEDLAPIVIMEYLEPSRSNDAHQKAAALFQQLNYKAHLINASGGLDLCTDIDQYLVDNKMESDNVVFVKTLPANSY